MRFYMSAAAAIAAWYLLRRINAPPVAFASLGLFLLAMATLALRSDAAGMEIRDGIWSFFVGRRRWSVALGDVGVVRILGAPHRPLGLSLSLRDGRVLRLPARLVPERRALESALAWRGIRVEA